MVIKGTVHNGQIHFDSGSLPEGTQVLITPVNSIRDDTRPVEFDLAGVKIGIKRIADSPNENDSADIFSGADHDKLLYGIQ